MMDNLARKKIVITVVIIIGLIFLGFLVWLFTVNKPSTDIPPQSADSVTIDPITGEKIITTKRISPETDSSNETGVEPAILGASNIEPLFGDEVVFSAIQKDVLRLQFRNSDYVKISPKNIVKNAVNNETTKEYYLLIEFDVYLDNNNTDKHRVSVKSQRDGLIYGTIVAPNGTVNQLTTSIYGSD